MPTRSIKVNVGGKQDTRHVRQAGSMVGTFADQTVGHFRRIAGAVFNLRSMLAGGVLGTALNKLTREGDQVDKLSQRLTITAREFQVLRHALELGGSGAGGAEVMFRTLVARIYQVQDAGDAAARTFQDLGVDLDALREMAPMQQFEATFQALGKIEDKSRRAALAQQLYGRSGMALLPVLNSTGGHFDQLAAKMERNGQLLSDEQIAKSAAFRDALTDLNRAIQATAFDILEQQIGDLSTAIQDLIESGKIQEWGEKAAAGVRSLYTAVQDLGGFVARNREVLFFGARFYVAYRAAGALAVALGTLTAAITAAGGAAAGLKVALTGMAGGVVTGGVALLIALLYDLRSAAGEARREIESLRDLDPGATGSYLETGFWAQIKNFVTAQTGWMTFGKFTGLELYGDPIETGPARRSTPEEIDQRQAARDAAEEREQLIGETIREAIELANQQEIAARAAAAARIEAEIEDEQDRRRKIAETEEEIENLKVEAVEAGALRLREARLRQLQDEAQDDQDRLARVRRQGQDLASAAREASSKFAQAWQRLLDPEGAAADDAEAKRAAKAEARIERRISSARRREAELMRGGLDRGEARGRLTRRSQEVLAADDLRVDAARAEGAVEENRQEQIALDRQIVDSQYALQQATLAAEREAEKLRATMESNSAEIARLRQALETLAQPARPEFAGMTPGQLAGFQGEAAAIAATDPARMAAEALRQAVWGSLGLPGGAPGPDDSTGALPSLPGLPAAPADPQAPGGDDWQRDIAAMRKSLEHIEKIGGLS